MADCIRPTGLRYPGYVGWNARACTIDAGAAATAWFPPSAMICAHLRHLRFHAAPARRDRWGAQAHPTRRIGPGFHPPAGEDRRLPRLLACALLRTSLRSPPHARSAFRQRRRLHPGWLRAHRGRQDFGARLGLYPLGLHLRRDSRLPGRFLPLAGPSGPLRNLDAQAPTGAAAKPGRNGSHPAPGGGAVRPARQLRGDGGAARPPARRRVAAAGGLRQPFHRLCDSVGGCDVAGGAGARRAFVDCQHAALCRCLVRSDREELYVGRPDQRPAGSA